MTKEHGMKSQRLSREIWEASVSGRCWEYTPYDGGWDECAPLRSDAELVAIVKMENSLDRVPDWAARVVETSIAHVPFCGHYRFPEPHLEVLDAIGAEVPPAFNRGCFTVDSTRKRALEDYCLALDAWEAGVSFSDVADELAMTSARAIDWNTVCRELWGVLGERTEVKRLLVARLLHYLRWWLKSALWDDDRADRFARDEYLGPPAENEANLYAHPDRPAPGIDESASPRVVDIESRLADIFPGWDRFRTILLEEWWLCAPKAFRFLERKLWFVGKGELPDATGFEGDQWTSAWWKAFLAADVPGFLHVEDTYPDLSGAPAWWSEFTAALTSWWRDEPASGGVARDVYKRLGERTDVKRWLVRLYNHRMHVLRGNGEQFARLVGPVS